MCAQRLYTYFLFFFSTGHNIRCTCSACRDNISDFYDKSVYVVTVYFSFSSSKTFFLFFLPLYMYHVYRSSCLISISSNTIRLEIFSVNNVRVKLSCHAYSLEVRYLYVLANFISLPLSLFYLSSYLPYIYICVCVCVRMCSFRDLLEFFCLRYIFCSILTARAAHLKARVLFLIYLLST